MVAADPRARGLTVEALAKCPTGIQGLDEILGGGLPQGRPTLVVGGPGCGKTVLGVVFLGQGILAYDEPGVLIAFEERRDDLIANFASLGFDLAALEQSGKLMIDHVGVDPAEIAETGEYDLEGLFIRLKSAIDSVGARRVTIDTPEVLFAGLKDQGIVRSELRRLFEWLKGMGVTVIVTAERGGTTMTRHGLEEYVADCVISLENGVEEGVATRRLRVVKYRGSAHGVNVYPFLIDDEGVSVLPITSLRLDYDVSSERISSGNAGLDVMLDGGVFRGSSVLVSGTAGVGKTSLSATFVDAACRRGEKVLYLAFEESGPQIVRNMRSLGLDLGHWVERGLLQIVSARPTTYGLEMHLAEIHRAIERVQPRLVVVDPVTNFIEAGTTRDTRALLARLIDMMKGRGTSAIFTSLTHGGGPLEGTDSAVSSMMDTWILLRDVEAQGERNRVLHVLKSRGSSHSNQVREFLMGPDGIQLVDVYTGTEGMVLGSARIAQQSREEAGRVETSRDLERQRRDRERRRGLLEARIAALQTELELADQEAEIERSASTARTDASLAADRAVAKQRHADPGDGGRHPTSRSR